MWLVDKDGKVLNMEDPGCANHHMAGIRYALGKMGRLKQEATYWDRVFEEELNPQHHKALINKGK